MATQVILLERVENLGNMGDVVAVRPGYARNYLLPQKKALRASKENIAYFEAQKKRLQSESDKRKKDAEKLAKKFEGLKVPLIRAASESGQLYGSVTARDIASEVAAASKEPVTRTMVALNQNFKAIGLFPVDIYLHPEVKIQVTINIARSAEEAQIQAETGRALISDESGQEEEVSAEPQLEGVLEEGALEAVREKTAEGGGEAGEKPEKAARKQDAESESQEDKAKAEKPKKSAKKAQKEEE